MRSLLLAVVLAACAVRGAGAHAVLLDADPPDGGIYATAPSLIRLHFNEPVTPVAVRLFGPDGVAVPLPGAAAAVDDDIQAPLPAGLAHGGYLLSYRVISADTHPVGGSLSFVVGTGSEAIPSAATSSAEGWERAFPLVHAVMLMAAALAVGGALFHGFVDRRISVGHVFPAAVTAAGAAVIEVGVRGAGLADASIVDVFGPVPWRLGLSTAMGPGLGLLWPGLLSAVVATRVSAGRIPVLALIAGALTSAGLGLTSHAALASPIAVAFPAFVIHVLVAGFWLGSLPMLVRALRSGAAAGPTIARFSRLATVGVAALLLAGVALTLVQTGSDPRVWLGPAWTQSGYGSVLALKAAVAGAVLVLALYHKRRLTPELRAGNEKIPFVFRRSVLRESGLMVVVFALAAALNSLEPPRSVGALASVHDHAGEGAALYVVRQNYGILLEVSPARVGSNEITLRFSDTVKNNARVRPLEVIVALSSPSAGIEPLRRRAKAIEEGAYRVELMPMPVQGTWRVEVEALIGDFDKLLATVDVPISGP